MHEAPEIHRPQPPTKPGCDRAKSSHQTQRRRGKIPDVTVVVARDSFDTLFAALARRGYECVGPTVRDGAIVYDRLRSPEDLPRGWTDEQAPGHYRLHRRNDEALFGYVVGPHSWKKFVFPPERRLWQLRRGDQGFERVDEPSAPPRYAFLGVRACELAALGIQDRVFAGGEYAEPHYRDTRAAALVIAVECTESAATCFCDSMNTGPGVDAGFDLALTEVLGDEHVFVARAGSDRGAEILAELPTRAATAAELDAARAGVENAADQQQRRIDPEALPELMAASYESPRWEQIAERCLSCANCTLACPTCFCSDVEDVSDLTGEHAERWRRWDSCFNPGFSYLYGGEVRKTTASRYRQWLTHKLGSWVAQFGSSGCVGCGRCITWCPVGIDLIEEVAQLRGAQS